MLIMAQAGIIIIFCRLLHYPLSLLRQPRVIAEVIGGILLGPSVMGRIPGFTDAIFPEESIPNLSLVANLGLVLFLFIVGLEVDLRYFVSNWKLALSVGIAGMALPFGLGCAISWGLYHEFRDEEGLEPIAFGTYMLFIGIAMAITAFPVLCRILTELKLLSTSVGVIVLSAGVGNDVVGWILLALCVALVNAGSGITALWVLLTCLGYALFLAFVVRPLFMRVLRRSGALQDGPSQGIIALTLLLALASSFFTGVIGVHAIFGAFMMGLICPHEGGFAIKVTEKVEDLIGALFLPLYFTLSGLSTNLGLLDTGMTWAYVVGVIAVAFCAKFLGCSLAARLNGLVWRESFSIGALMSCKGLVELIVLNIGLQAKILSTRTFTIFVVMALVTTFATTPLTAALYPPWYQRKLEAWKRGEIDWDSGAPLLDSHSTSDDNGITKEKLESSRIKSLLIYLRLDNMPTLLAFLSLLGGKPSDAQGRKHPKLDNADHVKQEATPVPVHPRKRTVEVHGVRLIELNERSSTVMRVAEVDEYSAFDPVLNTFRVLGQLYNLAVSGEVSIVPESSYADILVNRASEESSDLLVLPWSETGSMSEAQTISKDSVQHKLASDSYSNFVAKTLNIARCNTAIFVNKGFSGTLKQKPHELTRRVSALSIRSSHKDHLTSLPNSDRSHHIFMPYFGGADGRVALRLLLQLAENPDITATIVHYPSNTEHAETTVEQHPTSPKSPHGNQSHLERTFSKEDDAALFATLQRSLAAELESRVVFESATASSTPLQDAITRAQAEVGQNPKNGGDIVIVSRNTQASHGDASCLGPAADAYLASTIRASLLVVQARGSGAV
jgi:Kef-type K+ transport system membrane component KefB